MTIKVLGSGCCNCKKLLKHVEIAVKELGVNATIEKVEDLKDIVAHGVMKTPALIIDNKIKASGRIPKVSEIKKYLQG